jgi:tripartite-type tricarboxylate transporter receptor subunit TctC
VVQNMPGAGSLRAANYIANVAPRDGTAMAAIDRQLPLTAVMGGGGGVQFDPKTLTWIGSLSSYEDDAFILWARKDGPAQSVADLRKAGAPPLTVGGIADGSTDNDVIVLLRDALRLNVKLIPGYPDGNSIALAVERREVDGRMAGVSSISSSRPDWLGKDSIVTPVLGFGRTTRHPKFPDMPIVLELAPDARARSMVEIMQMPYRLSRPYISPPGVAPDRAAALREAFMKAAASSAFLAEAERLKIDVSPLDGAAVTKLVADLADAPAEALADVKAMLARR